MSIQQILGAVGGGGGLLLVLMTLVQLAPVKVNPWTWLAKVTKNAIYGDVLKQLTAIEGKLDGHIEMDDRRCADGHRARILHFNNELLRDIDHTKEEFTEVLREIDAYEKYCRDHPEYPNNRAVLAIENIRAVLAIENIREVYKDRLREHDFLQESSAARHEEA